METFSWHFKKLETLEMLHNFTKRKFSLNNNVFYSIILHLFVQIMKMTEENLEKNVEVAEDLPTMTQDEALSP